MTETDYVLTEVSGERERQKSKGYDIVHDDAQGLDNFCDDIEAYTAWARQMFRMRSPSKYRKRMIQIAALAVAACESFDRKKS